MRLAKVVLLAGTLLVHPLSRADVVADWNKIALDAAVQSSQPLEYRLRAMAMVHVAMFETLNFIEGRYDPHFIVKSPEARDGMSIEAAVAAAAYHVLVDLYPYQRPAFAATLKNSVHTFPGSQVTANSVATGTSIGAVICTTRASDGPGLEPWLLKSANQLRPKVPLAPQGPAPAPDDDHVNASIHFDTSPLSWNSTIAELTASRGLSPIESARIHALVSMAIADAYTAAQGAEYPCAACVAATAVAIILESELGARLALASALSGQAGQDMAREIGQQALRRYRIAPQADTVHEWSLIATRIVTESGQGPAQAARAMTMVHVAMFEALNFIEARYVSQRLVVPPQPLRMSGAAVAAAAAHQTLVKLYPGEKLLLDDLLRATLAKIPQNHNKESAVIQGRYLAVNVYVQPVAMTPERGAMRAVAGESPLALYAAVSELAAARGLDLLESARLHALISEAISRTYAGAPDPQLALQEAGYAPP